MLYTADMLSSGVSDIHPTVVTQNVPDFEDIMSNPSSIPTSMNFQPVEPNGFESPDDIGGRINDKFEAIDHFREITGKPLANPE